MCMATSLMMESEDVSKLCKKNGIEILKSWNMVYKLTSLWVKESEVDFPPSEGPWKQCEMESKDRIAQIVYFSH